jgi:predicted transposase YbfD/YdcC
MITPMSIEEAFVDLEDPRVEGRTDHKLQDIIVIAICAVICGANGWTAVEVFGETRKAWLSEFLELPAGIPTHDTFGRVFGMLDAEAFQRCFNQWVKNTFIVKEGQVIGIDGKTSRGSGKGIGNKAIHMVSAWAQEARVVLGQVKTEEKSNEITAIPELLDQLFIKGCIITIDAMGCQKKIVAKIIEKEADYVLPVKGNQGNLERDIIACFTSEQQTNCAATQYGYAKTVNKGHGRIEIRECWTVNAPQVFEHIRHYEDWANLHTIALIRRERRLGEKISIETHCYISSLASDAALILSCSRQHWAIENNLHWVLDVVFREDHAQNRKDNSAENMTVLRHITLNLLNQMPKTRKKLTIPGKRLKAALDSSYLSQVLQKI